MPMAYQTDEQIAGVLTYVRSNFGNDAPPVSPEEVAALRSEVGKPQLTADQLIQPEPANPQPITTETGEPAVIPAKYADMDSDLGLPFWLVGLVLVFILVCVVAVFKK